MPGRSFQDSLLRQAAKVVDAALAELGEMAPLLLAEGLACDRWSIGLERYWSALNTERRGDPAVIHDWMVRLRTVLPASIPTYAVVATLAEPFESPQERREAGRYYTDWRLARHLALRATRNIAAPRKVADPAAGSGVLLGAVIEALVADGHGTAGRLVAEAVDAADLHTGAPNALAATMLAVCGDLSAVTAFVERIFVGDSLTRSDWSAESYDILIANPPWERIRSTRHERLIASGVERHYGDDYEVGGSIRDAEGTRISDYAAQIRQLYGLSGRGDVDTYHGFLGLLLRLLAPGGGLALYCPAGLIRSQGSSPLREQLLSTCPDLTIDVFSNHARFFAIDTRFKFLAVSGTRVEPTASARLTVTHPAASDQAVEAGMPVPLLHREWRRLPAALGVPEVRSTTEKRLFQHMCRVGRSSAQSELWRVRPYREVDMTLDRKLFTRGATDGIPVLEGRMLTQYRARSKQYVAGTGRAALWTPVPLSKAREIVPQFRIAAPDIPSRAQARIELARVGFCDIVGQTNERTLHAAMVPAGVVCGNKVPTLEFQEDVGLDAEDRRYLFIAVANSFAVDWLLRRVVTTTLNFFILLNLPLPNLDPRSQLGRRLIELAKAITLAEGDPDVDLLAVARYRAEVDKLVFEAYGVSIEDWRTVLSDFALLDRGQPAINDESASTVTVDLLLATGGDRLALERYDQAVALGALPYVPEEFASIVRGAA